MNEQEPKYFTSFKNEFGEFKKDFVEFKDEVRKEFKELKKDVSIIDEKVEIIDKNQGTHFDQIGKLTVQVTQINTTLKRKGVISDIEEESFSREEAYA